MAPTRPNADPLIWNKEGEFICICNLLLKGCYKSIKPSPVSTFLCTYTTPKNWKYGYIDTLTAYMEESISFIFDLQPGFHISHFSTSLPRENANWKTVSSDDKIWQIEKITLLDWSKRDLEARRVQPNRDIRDRLRRWISDVVAGVASLHVQQARLQLTGEKQNPGVLPVTCRSN